jgi:hypothetical protein
MELLILKILGPKAKLKRSSTDLGRGRFVVVRKPYIKKMAP